MGKLTMDEWVGKRVRIQSNYYSKQRSYLKKEIAYVVIELPTGLVTFISHNRGECNCYIHKRKDKKQYLIKRVEVKND